MAVLSMFYGIIVSMYYFDNRQHHVPHIHVRYQEHEVVISLVDGSTLEGDIPTNKMKLVQAWLELHKDELTANWSLAISGENIFTIDPLR
jgi:Domain of unknown function (DUF4160)